MSGPMVIVRLRGEFFDFASRASTFFGQLVI